MSAHRPADGPPGRPTVLVVGAASRDLVEDDPRGWRLGGAVCFASLALARLGFEAWALIGADEAASRAAELDVLRESGVAIAFAPLASGPVFDNVRHVLHATSDHVPLTALPRRWTSGFDGLLLVPVAGEVSDDWAALAGGDPGPIVGLGWQGLLRHLAAGELVRPRPPIASRIQLAADIAVVSREDVAAGTTEDDLLALLRPGATLVWTEGADGGRVLSRGANGTTTTTRYDPVPSDGTIDATGAGDVFLATLLAARLDPGLGEPLHVAAAAASLTVEGPGLAGVPDLAAVRRRMTRLPSRASRRPSASSSRASGRPSQA